MDIKERGVVLIGSSGGGAATLGHTQTDDFVSIISDHLHGIQQQVRLVTVLFVSLDDGSGFDAATGEKQATLVHIQNTTEYSECKYRGTLDEINEKVKKLEGDIADGIRRCDLHGLISVSCNPSLFPGTFSAAGECNIPVAGTGGTSLAGASTKFNLRLIGNSGGSVATTPETKAISFANAFAQEWGFDYDPFKVKKTSASPPTWRSILNATLPAFWSVAMIKRLLVTTSLGKWIPVDGDALMEALECHALPIACAVIMATSRRKTENVLMAAVLAGCACSRTILGGLLAGWIVAFLEERMVHWCILYWNIPATMTNILSSGFVGMVTAVLMAPICPVLSMVTAWYRNLVGSYLWTSSALYRNELARLFAVSMIGSLFCYGSKVGWCE